MSVPKQWTNQKTTEVGQAFQAFVYSSWLAWQLLHLTATWQSRHSALRLFFKLFLRPASRILDAKTSSV